MEEKKKQILKAGNSIILLLLFLTISEYLIGAYVKIWWGAVSLLVIAGIKTAFVMRDYMHIGRLFSGDQESH
jgi:hypothetical protein